MTFVFLLASGLAIAKPTPSSSAAIRKVEQIEKKLRFGAVEDCNPCEVSHAGKDDPDWRQCLTELCPDGFASLDRVFNQTNERMKTDEQLDFRRQLQSALRNQLLAKKRDIADIRAAIAENRQVSDPAARRLMRWAHLQSAPAGKLSPEDQRTYLRIKERYLELTKLGPLVDPVEVLRDTKSDTEIASLMAKGRAELEASDKRLFALTKIHDSYNAQALAGANLPYSPARFTALQTNLRSSRLMELILTDTALDAENSTISMKAEFSQYDGPLKTQEKLFRRYTEEDYDLGTDELANTVRQELANCISGYYDNLQFAPTPAQNAAFQSTFPARKEKFLNGLRKHISTESAGTLANAAKNWTLAMPETAEVQKANFLEGLKNFETLKRGRFEATDEASRANPDFALAVQVSQGMDGISLVGRELNDVCSTYSTRPVRDAHLINRNELVVGPYSVTDPKFGDAIVRHELGHFASDSFRGNKMSSMSTKWYKDIRSCLQKIPGQSTDVRVEENWADLGARLTDPRGFACDIIHDRPEDFTLDAPESDEHASPLYRIFVSQHATGQPLPRSCTIALARRNQKFVTCDPPPKLTAEAGK